MEAIIQRGSGNSKANWETLDTLEIHRKVFDQRHTKRIHREGPDDLTICQDPLHLIQTHNGPFDIRHKGLMSVGKKVPRAVQISVASRDICIRFLANMRAR